MLGGNDQAMTDNPAIMLCAHVDDDPSARDELTSLAAGVRTRLSDFAVTSAALNDDAAMLSGMSELCDNGAKQIILVPTTIFAAADIKSVLPAIIARFHESYTDTPVTITRELGTDPLLLQSAKDRIEAALGGPIDDLSDTLLLLCGDGSPDADANAGFAKTLRLVWEGLGFGWAEACYIDGAAPSISESVEKSIKLGFSRIVVFPYVLSTGAPVSKVSATIDTARHAHTHVRFVNVAPLGQHDRVLDALAARVTESVSGGVQVMNCQVCTFREQVLAIEDGHHHHEHHHDHDHANGHTHSHDD